MSSEQYLSKIPDHHRAIAQLQQEKARESEKIAAITKKSVRGSNDKPRGRAFVVLVE